LPTRVGHPSKPACITQPGGSLTQPVRRIRSDSKRQSAQPGCRPVAKGSGFAAAAAAASFCVSSLR
jgi:hypothetical protein